MATSTARDLNLAPAWLIPIFKDAVEDLESNPHDDRPEWYRQNRQKVLDLYDPAQR